MKSIALANNICATLGILPGHEVPQFHGQVALANDQLTTQATYVQELSTHGIGFADPRRNELMHLLNFLAPARLGGRNIVITQYDEDEPFETVDYQKVKREPGADFPQVRQRTAAKVSRIVPNRGLTVCLDRDQLAEKPNWQQIHVEWLIDLLTRASVLETIALIEAAALTDTFVWDAGANPDLDIENTLINVLAPTLGFKPNRALYGEAATLARKIAYEAQDNAGAFARAALMTDDQIAGAIGVEGMRTNAERCLTGGSKETFLGSKVLLFTAVDRESPEDPSNIVRHVAPSFGGGNYAVYVHEAGPKKVFITVENYELIQVQHTSGLELITVNQN